MGDVDRDAVSRVVYRHLADPAFRERLTARDQDGSRPVLIAVEDDSLESLLRKVQAVGGNANVAVAYLNGVVVLAVKADDVDSGDPEHPGVRCEVEHSGIGPDTGPSKGSDGHLPRRVKRPRTAARSLAKVSRPGPGA